MLTLAIVSRAVFAANAKADHFKLALYIQHCVGSLLDTIAL